MSGPVQPPLTVETVDGTTSGRPITKIKVTNGDLTISGSTATIDTSGAGGGGTVTSVGLSETGSALTITGSPITGAGTINIAGAGTSSQVILGDLSLGTLTSGTVTSVGTSQAFITITNPTSTPSITIGNASASATGVLTATDWTTFNNKGSGTVTSVGLTETGSALTITGSPITGSGTINIAGAGTSSQVILGDLSLGTLTSGTVTSVGTSQAFITITNPTSTPSITIGNASASASGVLTATDWTTFNNKGSGTVTQITAGAGLSGGTITSSGTIALPNQGSVTAGAYTRANITVDARGIITDIANGGGGGTVTGTGSANQVSYWTAASVQAGSTGLTYNPSTGDLTVGGYVETGTKVTTPSGTNLELTTGSASSGSIVVEDGSNGQISITPNGTGKIKLDGVELDNSAIATGYVLKATSATAAGWAAESGGGGGSPGGSTNEVQVNNGGSFEGAGGFEYNTDSTSSSQYRHVSIDPTQTFSPQSDWSLSVFGDTNATSPIQGAIYANGTFQVFGDAWVLGGFGATKNALKFFPTINNVNYIGLAPPSSVTTSTILTLPDGDGSANQLLNTDGSGNLGWTNPKALAGTPASSTASGKAGELQYDSSYLYVCTAVNTWKRVAISSW